MSNLDIVELDYKPPYSQNFETNIFNYEGNFKTKIKTLFKPWMTYEINGKFLITYTYYRGMSTTTIFDMRNNYKKVLEKSYLHKDIYGFPDKDTIVLPPNTDTYGTEKERFKFIFLNLNNFELRYIEYVYLPQDDENYYYDPFHHPMLIHKLKEEKYLLRHRGKWRVVKYNGKIFEIVEELKDKGILEENICFLNKNTIITFNFEKSLIKFFEY